MIKYQVTTNFDDQYITSNVNKIFDFLEEAQNFILEDMTRISDELREKDIIHIIHWDKMDIEIPEYGFYNWYLNEIEI